jgi:hypothetical protein
VEMVNVVITIPDYVMARDVGEEMVILNLNNERYYGLDAVGARIWSALTTTLSVQAALEMLQAEYAVDRDQLMKDIEHLLDEMVREGLLEITSH